jgi:tetratricopeptide (TPR) repeat protein
MGDPVSVADELKDLAPAGHVYVGIDVYRATREVFEYREVEATATKGRDTPVRVFELLSEQERLHRARIGSERRVFSTLVGRDDELSRLRGALARLHDGHGAIVTVLADAGLGKSRLLAEVAASDEARDVAWCEGRSVSTWRHLSFHTIVDLCRSLVGIVDADDADQALGKLNTTIRRLLPESFDEALPFVAMLLGLPLDASAQARLEGLQGDAMEKLTLRSVTELLRARSHLEPLVIVLDDLQWADVSSIELLESLLRLCEEHPILFVPLFRPGFPTTSERVREQARGRHALRHLEIELRPLDAAGTRSMLDSLFRQEDLPRATRQLIQEKARGNPFYIEEVIRALVDEGAVEHVEGRFRATEKIGSVAIPGSIHELVMARVDGLAPAKRQLLQTASVIGGTFSVEVLAAVVEEGARVAEDVEELVHAEFLVRSERAPERECAFKHPLFQEVTYEGLLHTRREALHRRVGEAMERVFPEDMPGYAGMLAYHYGMGGVVDRAETFLFRAGAEAARAAAPSEALHFFEQASKLYLQLHQGGGDPAKRALLEKNIAQALYYRGRFVEAIDHFNLALRLLGDRVVERRLELGLRFAVNMAAVLVRLYGPGIDRFTAAPATDRQREIMELRYARAEATVTSQPTRHVFDSIDSLAFLQRVDPRSVPLAGKFFAGAAALFAFGGLSFGVSRRLSARAHALVRPGSLDEYLYERAMNFTCRVLEGDWADDHEIEPVLIAESVRNGQLWGPTTYLGLLGEKRIHRGDFASARACLEEIDGIWDLFQYDLAKTNHYYLNTLWLLEQGDLPKTIEAANAYYDENPEDLLHILALAAKGKAQTQLGDLDAAEETLRHAAAVVARSSPVPPFHASSYHRSRLLLDLAHLEHEGAERATKRVWARRARKSMRAALGSAAKVAWRRTEVLRLAGRCHGLLGHAGHALRFFDRSADVGERLGARPETARTYADAGRFLCDRARSGERFRGLDGAACMARARETFEQLGLGGDLERMAGSTSTHAP